jgi:hypothetical protein
MDFVDKIFDGVENLSSFIKAYSRTVDEQGVFKTLSGKAQDVALHNFLAEYDKNRYDKWLQLKDDPTFSRAILRYIWYLSQTSPNEKYIRDIFIKFAFEDSNNTKTSYDNLKENYPKLIPLNTEALDFLISQQTELFCEFKDYTQEDIDDYLKGNDYYEGCYNLWHILISNTTFSRAICKYLWYFIQPEPPDNYFKVLEVQFAFEDHTITENSYRNLMDNYHFDDSFKDDLNDLFQQQCFLHNKFKNFTPEDIENYINGTVYYYEYYDLWIQLKNDATFSPAILRFLWYSIQENPPRKYYNELVIIFAFEDHKFTERSLTHLIKYYPGLFNLNKNELYVLFNQQIILSNRFKNFNQEDIERYINEGK